MMEQKRRALSLLLVLMLCLPLAACVCRRLPCFILEALAVVRKMTAAMYALVNQAVIQSDPPQK